MNIESIFNPKVCIIIPVYNGSNYIEEAIQSALSQTYNNIEIIVVNDGSNDEGKTSKIVSKYIEKIKYIEKLNGGVSSALNVGISITDADYISWLSHDDYYRSDKIQLQINALKTIGQIKNKIMVGCNDVIIDSSGKVLRKRNIFKKNRLHSSVEYLKYLLFKSNVNGCSLLIPKSAFKDNSFNCELRYMQDYFMWITLALKDYQLIGITEHCVYNRVHQLQQTNKISNVTYLSEKDELNKYLIDYFSKTNRSDYKKIIYMYLKTSSNHALIIDNKINEYYKGSIFLSLYIIILRLRNLLIKKAKTIYNFLYIKKFRR